MFSQKSKQLAGPCESQRPVTRVTFTRRTKTLEEIKYIPDIVFAFCDYLEAEFHFFFIDNSCSIARLKKTTVSPRNKLNY